MTTFQSDKFRGRWNELEDFYNFNEDNQMHVIKWYQSKTVWFNVVLLLVAVLAMPEFVKVLPVSWLQYTTLLGAVGNWILRVWFTSSTISTPTNPPQ